MQVASYRPANPSDFMRCDHNCIKPCVAHPSGLRNVSFGRTAQTYGLGRGYGIQASGDIVATFNLYERQQISPSCDDIDFCAPSIPPGRVPGFHNTKPVQTQIHPRDEFSDQTCYIRICHRIIIQQFYIQTTRKLDDL